MGSNDTLLGQIGKLTTDFGDDRLLLARFRGSDFVNDLFDYKVEAVSKEADLDFDQILGTRATVSLKSPQHGEKYYNGIVTEVAWAGVKEGYYAYTLTLRPWFWLGTRRRNQRIFHEMTVAEIIEKVFSEYDGAFTNNLTLDYPELEYTVQQKESDFDFCVRQMQRFGISYYFEHLEDAHVLVMTDSPLSHNPVAGDERPYKAFADHQAIDEENFWDWGEGRRLTTGSIMLMDYDFKNPNVAMRTTATGESDHPNNDKEGYDFPGDYLTPGDGAKRAAMRVRQERGQDHHHSATGDCMSLCSGLLVQLTGDHPGGFSGEEYLCMAAHHEFTSEDYTTGGSGGDQAYIGHYTMMPSNNPLAPERTFATPMVLGAQTAVVVGARGEEIDVDEFGRILVRFHWDLNQANSMRCRVSQSWASSGWGGMVIPRIGMEVVVEFIDGEPDKPLVVGCVYNGKNGVPYPLPENKTRSTFRTDSHKSDGFNELRFEDKTSAEEIWIHAQKDRNEKTLNNHSEAIGQQWMQYVGANKGLEVHNTQFEYIGGDYILGVGPGSRGTITQGGGAEGISSDASKLEGQPGGSGDYVATIERNQVVTIGVDSITQVGANSSLEVAENVVVTNGKDYSLTVGKNLSEAIADNHEVDVGKDFSLNVERQALESVGKKKIVDVGDELILKVGSSQITMKKNGDVTIEGKNLSFKASGKIDIKASKAITLKGSKINTN